MQEGVIWKTKVTDTIVRPNFEKKLYYKVYSKFFGFDDYVKLGYLYSLNTKQGISKNDKPTMNSCWMALKIGKLEKYSSPHDFNPSEVITLAAYKMTLPEDGQLHFHGEDYYMLCLDRKGHALSFFTRTEIDRRLWFEALQVASNPFLTWCLNAEQTGIVDGSHKLNAPEETVDQKFQSLLKGLEGVEKTQKKMTHKRNRSLDDTSIKKPLERTRTFSWEEKEVLDSLLHMTPFQQPLQKEPTDNLHTQEKTKGKHDGEDKPHNRIQGIIKRLTYKEQRVKCPEIFVTEPECTESYL